MTDSRLRELERRWKETGSVEDEVAYLKARLRSSEVTRERVELAAHLLHQPAIAALAQQTVPATLDVLETWAERLAEWGAEAQIRSAAAACRGAPSGNDITASILTLADR